MKSKLLLLAAVLFCLLFNTAMFTAMLNLYSEPAGCVLYYPHETSSEVVVVTVDLEAGTFLASEHLKFVTVPNQFLPAHPLLAEDLQGYLGRPLLEDIEADSMVLTTDFPAVPPAWPVEIYR